jgi:hypothetical protein
MAPAVIFIKPLWFQTELCMTQKMRKMLGKTLKIAGCLLILQSGIIILPSLVALIYGEWYSAAGFMISGTILGSAGYLLYRLFRH